jgi:radical SAM protein with 4Fe4S-binding SPASM domain
MKPSMWRRLRRQGRLRLERSHPLLAARLKRLRRTVEPPERSGLHPASELIGGRIVVQEFTPGSDGLCGLAIRIGTFGRVNSCRLYLRVYRLADRSSGVLARRRLPRLLVEREIDASSLADGCDVTAHFPRVDDSRGRHFVVTFGAYDATPGNAVTAWLTGRSEPFGPLCVGAAKLFNTSVVCDLRYAPGAASRPYPEEALASPAEPALNRWLPPAVQEPAPSAELRGPHGLVQTFVAERDWLSGVSIRLSRSGTAADGVVEFRLFDLDAGTPRLAVQRAFEARFLAAGENLEVRFPSLDTSAGRRFALTLGSADGSPGSGAEAWLAGRRQPCERLWLNGALSQDLALICNVRYSSPNPPAAYPEAVLWSPVTRCNLNCRHCISRNTRLTGAHHLAQPIREEIRRLCRAGHIKRMATDYSGDLLFNEEKYGTLSELLDFDVDFVLDTHGTVMTAEIAARLLASRMTRVNFSLDAARPETYAWVRRGSRPLDQVLANVRLFAEARRATGSARTPDLTLSFTLMSRTVDETLPFLDIAADAGTTAVAFRHLEVYTSDMEPESLYGEQQRWNEARAQILLRAAALGLTVTLPPPFDDRPHQSGHSHCPVPWESVAILGNGDVMACCIPTAVIGNLNEQSLDEIWNSATYRAFRTRVNSETPPAVCSVCPPFGFANNRSSYLFSEVISTLRPLREELAALPVPLLRKGVPLSLRSSET